MASVPPPGFHVCRQTGPIVRDWEVGGRGGGGAGLQPTTTQALAVATRLRHRDSPLGAVSVTDLQFHSSSC